jgi:hypothetical protein
MTAGEILGTVADFASVVGLGISLYVAFEVRRVRTRFLRIARIPELKTQLMTLASQIQDRDVHQDKLAELFATCKALIRNVRKKLPLASAKKVQKALERYKPSESRDAVFSIYGDLLEVITDLDQAEKDSKWSP